MHKGVSNYKVFFLKDFKTKELVKVAPESIRLKVTGKSSRLTNQNDFVLRNDYNMAAIYAKIMADW